MYKPKTTFQFFVVLLVAALLSACSGYPKRAKVKWFGDKTGYGYDAEFYDFIEAYDPPGIKKIVVYKKVTQFIDDTKELENPEEFRLEPHPLKPIKAPPGSVWIGGNGYIDETEVSNIDWLEFLYYIKNDSARSFYESMQPAPTLFMSHSSKKGTRAYHKHPDYFLYPVVGISHKQAEAYCKWRTAMLMEALLSYPLKKKRDSVKFTYRLPTEGEWEHAALALEDRQKYPYGSLGFKIGIKVKENFAEYGTKFIDSIVSPNQLLHDIIAFNQTKPTDLAFNVKRELPYFLQFKMPNPVRSHIKNSFGLDNMIGNVAEMVAEPGIAKGGSWRHSLEEAKISHRLYYDRPTDYIGFRCACEISPL